MSACGHPGVALAASFLAACASTDDAAWHDRPQHPPLRPWHVEIDAAHLAAACRGVPVLAQDHADGDGTRRLMGCAVRLKRDDVCIIYTPPRPPAWVLEHEHRHCAGWDHR